MSRHEHDAHDFYSVLKNFPRQFPEALKAAEDVSAPEKPERIIIAGMGGSALPGDILDTYLRGEAVIYMNRDYGVPHWVDEKTLVVCVSYSGNTEETIESFLDARDRGAMVAVVTSGGELQRIAEKENVPLVKVPGGIQPRCATGYLFTAVLSILMESGCIGSHHTVHIREMAQELEGMEFEDEAKRIAHELKDHVPIIYASERFHSLARIWKIKINENVKVQAFHNMFPELNHNEMVGFTNLLMKPYIIFLENPSDHPRTKKRMHVTRDVLHKRHIPSESITMRGSSLITQIFSTLLMGDWISYYLAREYRVDPTPVTMVEDFKNLMNK